MRYETHHGSVTIEAADSLLGERERMTELVTIEATIASVKPSWRRGTNEVVLKPLLKMKPEHCTSIGSTNHG